MSLRIVHAVRSEIFAGVEQHIRRLAIAQAHAGDDVHVIGGDPDRMAKPLAQAGVGFTPAATTPGVISGLRRFARHADVVNTHMTAADGAAAIAFGRRSGPAIVSTRHFAKPRARLRPLGKWIDSRMDAEIAVSETVAAFAGVRTIVVPSGVESGPPRHILRGSVVLVAQRLQPEKNSADGIRAFAASGVHTSGWRLVVAGEGPDLRTLEHLARELGIHAAVSFVGFRDDLPDLMAASGLLLAPCRFEHLGLTVLESMSAGLPVIAADAGGHAELLGGLDPRSLYPPGDVRAAAAALRSLAADPVGRESLAAAARDRQQREHTLSAQVTRTRAVYERAIAVRRS